MKRILFVDDEPNVLDGLRRMLRARRNEWEMVFASSGNEALERLDATAFDVLVTDMRMPGMDGAELLARAKASHPRTVRVILSGHADDEACVRASAVAHQFLAKPCDAGRLTEVVERACRLDEMLHDPALRKLLGGIGELPVAPRTYTELLGLTSRPDVEIASVGEVIERDPGLVARVLRLVNSSYFGVRKEIRDVRHATTHLGLDTVRDIVLTLEVFRGGGEAGGVAERQQAHALLTGRIARRIVTERRERDVAFLAAMLHDIGELVIATHMAGALGDIDALAAREGTRQEAERRVLGATHAEIGAYLLAVWGMPPQVVESVAHHHEPRRVGHDTFGVVDAVHVADHLAAAIEGHAHDAPLDEEHLAKLHRLDALAAWREMADGEAGGG
jgi:HD-like signal output (HDOD) protein